MIDRLIIDLISVATWILLGPAMLAGSLYLIIARFRERRPTEELVLALLGLAMSGFMLWIGLLGPHRLFH